MDEIDRRTDEKQRQLAEVLEPSFAAAEDADLAATILVMALDHPVEEEDQSSYLERWNVCRKVAPLTRGCCS